MVAKRPIFSSGSIILVGFWVSRLPPNSIWNDHIYFLT